MKKIYLFLALAIAVAINANAQLYFVCDGIDTNNPVEIPKTGDNIYVGEVTTTANGAWFKISDKKGSWDDFDKGCLTTEYGETFELDKKVKIKYYNSNTGTIPTAGTYTVIVCLEDKNYHLIVTEKKPYHIHTWSWKEGDVQKNTVLNGALTSSEAKTFQKKEDGSYELVFPTPVTLTEGEYFLITYNEYGVIGEDKNVKYFKHDKASEAKTTWTLQDGTENYLLAAGTYYSATIKNGVLKFNTYAETTKGLDALLSKSADYVGIMTDIYVSHHWGSYYSICTTEEGSQAKQPNLEEGKEQDIVKWGDNPANFAQLDWFRIADKDNSLVGKQFQAGTIVSVADKKVVKYGTEATPVTFTPSLNIYRPISFTASKEDKEKFFLVTPQDGEKALVRGRYTKVAGNDYLTDNNGRKVAFLNNTSVKFVDRDDQWYEVECYINKNAETGIYDLVVFGAQVATGVESVETANATVFAANGNINVSSEAQAAIEVYTANGQMVCAINADNASIAVAPGFYLVKVGNQVSKVVVK